MKYGYPDHLIDALADRAASLAMRDDLQRPDFEGAVARQLDKAGAWSIYLAHRHAAGQRRPERPRQ